MVVEGEAIDARQRTNTQHLRSAGRNIVQRCLSAARGTCGYLRARRTCGARCSAVATWDSRDMRQGAKRARRVTAAPGDRDPARVADDGIPRALERAERVARV